MASKKIISVIGATGSQGGALVRAIAKSGGDFTARAVTRSAASAKSQELKKLRADVVEADVSNVSKLAKAIEGSYGLYCVTVMDPANPESEKIQAKSLAEAAKKAGVKHIVWSTLDDSRKDVPLSSKTMPTLHGKYKVPHFDAKAEADQYFADSGIPTTYMLTSFYWDNLINMPGMGPTKGPDGNFYMTIPMGKKRLAGIATEDIGKCALGLFKHPEYKNKRVGIAGEHLTVAQMAEKVSKALNIKVAYNEISFDTFRKFPFPGADDIGNMFQYYHDCEKVFLARRNIEATKKINPELMNFDQWLAKNKKNFRL